MNLKKVLLGSNLIFATFCLLSCSGQDLVDDKEPLEYEYVNELTGNNVVSINDEFYQFYKPDVSLINNYDKITYHSNIEVLVGTTSPNYKSWDLSFYCNIVAETVSCNVETSYETSELIPMSSNNDGYVISEVELDGTVSFDKLKQVIHVAGIWSDDVELRFGCTLNMYGTILSGEETIAYLSIRTGEIRVKRIN